MSNEAITWAYRQDITSGAKFVLVALADMADEQHSCFPGQAKLATMTGQSDRTVRRQLAELEEAGFITRARRFDSAGHRTSDRYTLPVEPVAMTTGQHGRRSTKPQVNHVSTTGHSDQVTQREPSTSPQPPASGGPSTHCDKHSKFRKGCARCEAAHLKAAKAAAAAGLSRAHCPDCGGTGWREGPNREPLGKCDHRRTAS